uniref:uncharacterized protein LOC122585989 isoform X2 n=1 Tax=Erigeron canadensis TaxID=72917 RepID=UPI001CB89715|nr:uncharacterized protein LOC122585989 isoform X2 [Erigeron canadensis]
MAELDAGADKTKYNTVFIDTNLDTRLVTVVSDSDTVHDLKRKLVLEHHRCFPEFGDVNVRCLKVKRRGNFYHLVDSMLVKSAFGAPKKDWFVTVEASRPEQDGVRHMDRRHAGDQLALPWVTNSRSVDRHDNHADRTSNLSLDCGSPSMHPVIAPCLNLKVPSSDKFTSGDSCKDVSHNIGEDRSTNDDGWKNSKPDSKKRLDTKVQEELLTVNKTKSKKRTREVQNKKSLEDAAGFGPSVKKQCKTQRLEGNVKALEEDVASKSGTGKLKHKAASKIDESLYEPELESKDLGDENTRGENNTAPNQVGTSVPSIVENVQAETHSPKNTKASETVPEAAMSVEKNFQQEMPFGISQMEKDTELLQQSAVDNEIPSSSMITVTGHAKAAECSTKQKAAEKEVSSTSFSKELHNVNMDTMDSSHKDLGSTGQDSPAGVVDKQKKERVEGKKRKYKNSVVESQDELLVKHADNVVGHISSTVPARVFDEKSVDAPEITGTGHSKAAECSTKPKAAEKEVSPTSFSKELHNINKDAMDSSHKDVGSTGQDSPADVIDKRKKERGEGKKKKSKKLVVESKDELLVKHADNFVGDISSTIPARVFDEKSIDEKKNDKDALSSAERNEVSEKTLMDDSSGYATKKGDVIFAKEVEVSEPTESMEEHLKKQSKDTRGDRKAIKNVGRVSLRIDESIVKHTSDATTATNEEKLSPRFERKESVEMNIDALPVDHGRNDDIMMNNDVESSKTDNDASIVNAKGVNDNSEKQNEKMDDGTKKSKTKKKAKKSAGRSDNGALVANEEKLLPQTEGNENMEMASIDALHIDHVRNDDIPLSNDVELSRTEKNVSQVNAGGITDELEKQNEKRDDGTKKSKKKKTKKSAGRSEDTGIVTTEGKPLPSSDIPKDNSHAIDFLRYFVPQPENSAPTDIGEDGKDAKLPREKKKKKTEVPSFVETEHDLQQSLALHDNKQNREQDDSRDGIAIQAQKSLSRKENNKALLSSKKISEVANDVVKDQKTRNIDEVKTPKATIKIDASRAPKTKTSEVSNGVVKDQNTRNTDEVKTLKRTIKVDAIRATKTTQASKGSRGPSPELSSMSENLGRSFPDKKRNQRQSTLGHSHFNSSKESAPAVKGLLRTPGAIFGDDSDESSADDNATVGSDSSTRTPSRRSSSSEESDSASSVDTRKNVVKRKGAYSKSTMNSRSSETKSMSDLLRSSSRFKKARFSASQQVGDSESQPVDFVPESQL